MTALAESLRRNRTRAITLALLAFLLFSAIQGMETKDWVVTLLRGLSVGALTFLVASGLSIIFGLMDVLNLAHGALFMLGAYIGWTVYVRPDTFLDVLTPFALLAAGLMLTPVWQGALGRLRLPQAARRVWPWVALLLAALILALTFFRYPISVWSTSVYTESPINYSVLLEQGLRTPPPAAQFAEASPIVVMGGIFVGGALGAAGLVGLAQARRAAGGESMPAARRIGAMLIVSLLLVVIGVVIFLLNDPLTEALYQIDTTLLFLLALAVAALCGALLGGLIEVALIRPLYVRPFYQLMLTLGLGFIGVEVVRAIWGRPEITVPRPSLFNATGDGCPAASLGDWLANRCSTIFVMDSRARTYNEIFIILVGLVVLVAVWLLIQRTRLGMILRAGVQDSQMVEALGINVRRVFTLVFALGVGLAAFGGVLAAPSIGLSNGMGDSFLLLALIALAIGGLTSFPGAAAGAVLVGVLQQFIIKYGQIGIKLPFLAEPFKPSPPLVPASTVLLMVVVLLILPQGLFGRKE